MNLLSGIVKRLRQWAQERRKAAPAVYLRVSNLTRRTALATCLEVADSGSTRNKGLLGRKSLAPGEGLWIIPCEAIHTFCMKFSIDLVYLDRKNRIKKLKSDVGPWRLSACFSAHSVLELPAGTIRATLTHLGDTIEFSSGLPAPEQGAAVEPGEI
jgi:hypothetical protein